MMEEGGYIGVKIRTRERMILKEIPDIRAGREIFTSAFYNTRPKLFSISISGRC